MNQQPERREDQALAKIDLLSKHLNECEECHSERPCTHGGWLMQHLVHGDADALSTAPKERS